MYLRRWLIGIGILAAMVAMILLYAFREQAHDLNSRGLVHAHYRWGKLVLVEFDENRDGVMDAWQRMAPGAILDSIETWDVLSGGLDSNWDGNYDVVWERHVQDGLEARVFWVDSDWDGKFDLVLLGEQGREILSKRASSRVVNQRN